MKCPLFLINSESCSFENCLEAGCAWWKKGDQCCAILSIAVDLTLLQQIQSRRECKEEVSNE